MPVSDYDAYLMREADKYMDPDNPPWFDAYDEFRLSITYPGHLPRNPETPKEAIGVLEELSDEALRVLYQIKDMEDEDEK